MRQIPQAFERYRHFKGKEYQILNIAKHTETEELLVIYQALYGDFGIYARPLAMFLERVDKNKYPKVTQEYRFEKIEKASIEMIPQAAVSMQPKETEGAISPTAASTQSTRVDMTIEEDTPPLDPLLLEFLDADSYAQRLNILTALHHRITHDMINIMAMATDIRIEEGELEERYSQLRTCIRKLEQFECSRIR
ncbi:MAG: DUF1653 domain-containing protein [Lachnospiraceae bacterium]|nr:DUF1653 domain-containing protein [Lachnospiraceae bacterium]